MIGIHKGSLMMINEVNTMTPRQNDLVVKNPWKKARISNFQKTPMYLFCCDERARSKTPARETLL